MQHHLQVGLGVAQAIDRGHRGHDDGVLAFQQRLGRRQAHLLDVLVDRRILLDEGIGSRHVGFGLVVVVVGNEVLHRIAREELLELPVQLRRQRLVVRNHQRRSLHRLDDLGNGECLARTGDAQQRLCGQAGLQAVDQLGNGLRLVARRFEV